ncbi:MAG: HEAT repeat domain-containing protein, partial [Planctomycetes bacterium]|nr:HEAT repeat domain-containing protein [Planctomycetota bacterium]
MPLAIAIAGLTAFQASLPVCLAQDDDGNAAASTTKTPADDAKSLFANFLHNAVLGKFIRADAFAKSLLAKNPDPLDVLKWADEHTNSIKTLDLLLSKIEVSESASQVMDLIREGELLMRRDPQRIKANIQKLGGEPQMEFNATNRLRDSGEYAVPWLVSTLQDDTQSSLHSRIIRMLPKMGKNAVNPLVIALKMDDNETKQFLVKALGQIGYPQAIPHLLAVLENPTSSRELRSAVENAISNIISSSPSLPSIAPGEAFLDLAKQYYADHGSVKADPRVDFANVWYWRDGRLPRTEVPREIFNEI